MKIAIVEWEDASSFSGWHTLDSELDDTSSCITIGLLCLEDDKRVTLALSRSENKRYSETMSIPKSCVKRIRYLKVKDA